MKLRALGLVAFALVASTAAVAAPRFVRRDLGAPPAAPNGGAPALELAGLDRKLADLEVEEKDAKKELAELGGKISEAHGRSLARGRACYSLTRAGMLPVGGGFDELG